MSTDLLGNLCNETAKFQESTSTESLDIEKQYYIDYNLDIMNPPKEYTIQNVTDFDPSWDEENQYFKKQLDKSINGKHGPKITSIFYPNEEESIVGKILTPSEFTYNIAGIKKIRTGVNQKVDIKILYDGYGNDRRDINETHWRQAKTRALDNLIRNRQIEILKAPSNVQLHETNWRYFHTVKSATREGTFTARIVTKGKRSVNGLACTPNEIQETAFCTATYRVLTAIAAEKNYKIHHIDILGTNVSESSQNLTVGTHYFQPPPGTYSDDSVCWKISGFLPDLCQHKFNWTNHIQEILLKMGLKRGILFEGLFRGCIYNECLYVSVLVDDLFVVASSQEIFDDFYKILGTYLELSYKGLVVNFAGMEFNQTETGIRISAEKYIDTISELTNLNDFSSVNMPRTIIEKDVLNNELLQEPLKSTYQKLTNRLIWIAGTVHPSISYATRMLSGKPPTISDFESLIHCIKYLQNHKTQFIDYRQRVDKLKNKYVIHAFCDGPFTPQFRTESVVGYVFYLNGNIVSWEITKSGTLARCSKDANLTAVLKTYETGEHVDNVLSDLGLDVGNVSIFQDDPTLDDLIINRNLSHRYSEFDIQLKYLRERELDFHTLAVEYIPPEQNFTQILTRNITEAEFENFNTKMLSGSGYLDNKDVKALVDQ
ncbi:hypothetical protein G210_4412 [Candida maltosa Xu316]|uniref:Reverse transcriptase Ty1/copia-type domain-containing protein n=1 Tax=Candida maltosa (strain Xu316) TaxID=1245528 RepID=M3J0M0_CANMX|nr:hypothetical protein G210_4412 [Candida maltosa Xu316]